MIAPPERPVLAGLKASIVPHRTWWRRQWFHADGARYYHRARVDVTFTPDADFYLRVDPALRELCRRLHGRGLITTPSCEGHFHDRRYFAQRWDELQSESARITRAGLPVRAAATGREYLFRDARYRLPWRHFEAFYEASLVHQATGYLGIVIPRQEHALHERMRASLRELREAECGFEPGAGRLLDASLLHILVHARDAVDGARRWHAVDAWIADRL